MFSEIFCREDKVTFYYKENIDFERASALISKYNGRLLLSAGNKPYLTMSLNKTEKQKPLDLIKNMLQSYIDLHTEKN
jgi:hypothetical protein